MTASTADERPPALVETFKYGAVNPVARHLGLTASIHRLSDDEARELVELVRRATPEPRAFNLNELGRRDRAKFERLVARAAGLEDDHFDKIRANESAAVKIRELARQAVRPRKLTPRQERAFLLEVSDHVRRGVLTAPTLAVIVLAVGEIFNGATGAPRGETVGSGATLRLVLDARYGFGEVDLPRWQQSLSHATKNGWLVTTRQGPRIEVGLGARTLRLLELTP